MTSDWWPTPGGQPGSSSTPGGPFTPARPLAFSTHTPTMAHRSTRFNLADELDPEDARMADNIRFAPSFAASPAGKLVMGGQGQGALSPGANGPGSVGGGGLGQSGGGSSPPGGGVRAGRSPTGRFAGGESVASPREARRKTMTHHVPDEDMPPTASLRDTSDSPSRPPVTMSGPPQLPTPPSLIPSSNTTTLLVFGPPPHMLHELERYLSDIGPIKSYNPGPEGTNWWVVEYEAPVSAAYALRRHGDIINGKYMLGVRVAEGVNSSAGGWGGGEGTVDAYRGSGPGRAMAVRKDPGILRTKEADAAKRGEGAWDDGENQGMGSKLAEWLFGR